jgi:phosphatidylglycerol---prolipoprotein diacylglyceryl transferase
MFINNIDPVLLSLGMFEIRYYGLVYAIGFLIGYLVLRKFVNSGKIKINEEQMDTYFLWLIIGSILMSRLFEVFIYAPEYYLSNFSESYKIWNGGLSFQGGIVGAAIVTWIFTKKYKIKFYDLADLLVIPTTLVLAIGKLANYTNSELYGTATSVAWCVIFQKVDTICRHPVQIYEFFIYTVLFLGLLWYYTRGHIFLSKHKILHEKHSSGVVLWTFVIIYSIARFFIAFLREEPTYFELNMGQWISLATLLFVAIFLWINSKNKA